MNVLIETKVRHVQVVRNTWMTDVFKGGWMSLDLCNRKNGAKTVESHGN